MDVKGRLQAGEVLERAQAMFERNLVWDILREAVNGPIVILERLDRHRLADKWVELPVTGVFEVHNGLITYWRDYFDAATILSQWPGR
ncbi:limonene-1,2-epoxide hydrolase family protein [Blastomonas sp.]|jgi:limonene-1,2-epoxide hydrolase|uniref:limonene-1,2-epoxide hydrolase family protein n=1 Tax=Blastomonas sp. TaxID=1909299 RepID=UPI00258EB8F0|nr:limonene-1,2-epoxide hydrolase family protein [Blastomonas sp.]